MGFARALHGIQRTGECDKERVALRIHLDPAVEQMGELVSVHVIPRPHGDVEFILPSDNPGAGASGK